MGTACLRHGARRRIHSPSCAPILPRPGHSQARSVTWRSWFAKVAITVLQSVRQARQNVRHVLQKLGRFGGLGCPPMPPRIKATATQQLAEVQRILRLHLRALGTTAATGVTPVVDGPDLTYEKWQEHADKVFKVTRAHLIPGWTHPSCAKLQDAIEAIKAVIPSDALTLVHSAWARSLEVELLTYTVLG